MASKGLIERLMQGFKRNPGFDEMERNLRDLDDGFIIQTIVTEKPENWWNLTYSLSNQVEDNEVKAHLLEFDSYADMQEELRKIEELKEKFR